MASKLILNSFSIKKNWGVKITFIFELQIESRLFIGKNPQVQDSADGVITDGNLEEFVAAIMLHRFWEREMNPLPA